MDQRQRRAHPADRLKRIVQKDKFALIDRLTRVFFDFDADGVGLDVWVFAGAGNLPRDFAVGRTSIVSRRLEGAVTSIKSNWPV